MKLIKCDTCRKRTSEWDEIGIYEPGTGEKLKVCPECSLKWTVVNKNEIK